MFVYLFIYLLTLIRRILHSSMLEWLKINKKNNHNSSYNNWKSRDNLRKIIANDK